VLVVSLNAFNATFVPGANDNDFNAFITCCNLKFSGGVRLNVLVPASIAGVSTGNACFNDTVAGVNRCPNSVRSTKNGCCTLNDCVDTLSVDGERRIVF